MIPHNAFGNLRMSSRSPIVWNALLGYSRSEVDGGGSGAVRYLVAACSASYTPPYEVTLWNHSPFLHDLNWTTMVFLFLSSCYGLLFLIVWDQRYRCRTCGRRLRMPVQTGRYAQISCTDVRNSNTSVSMAMAR